MNRPKIDEYRKFLSVAPGIPIRNGKDIMEILDYVLYLESLLNELTPNERIGIEKRVRKK